jgi:GAF domain-containing protein/CheY-like chemotaxis protein
MNNHPIRILLVDNLVDAREWLAEQLQVTYGFQVDTVNDGDEAISRVRGNSGQYDVMVIDLRLGSGPDGIETMKAIKAEYPDIETIIITGFGKSEDGIRAIEQGACNFVLKPVNHEHLAVYISSADERRRLRMIAKERDWLQHLLDLSQSMSSSVTPEDVADQIYERVQRLFPQVDAFYIAIREPDQKRMRSLLAVDKEHRSPFVCDDDFGLAGEVIRSRRPLFIDDLVSNGNQVTTRSFSTGRPVRSYTGVPLISGNGNEVVGVLSAQSYEPFAFNSEHKQLLRDMASRGAIIIENALLHKQKSRRLLVLKKLYETIAALRMQFSLDSVLDVIVKDLHELFLLDTCTIGLLDRKQTRFDFRAFRGFTEPITRLLIDLPNEMVQRAFESPEPIVVPNVDDVPELKRVLEVPDLHSFIVFPLHGKKKKLLGIINMGSKGSIELGCDDWSLLRALADQAAIAIEDDLLREDSKRWIQQLDLLDQVALEIASETGIRSLLRKMIEKATGLLHGTGGGIYLLKEGGKKVVLKTAFGLDSEMEGMEIDANVGVVGEVIRTARPYARSGYGQWEGRSEVFDKFNFTAVAGAPFFSSKGQLLGIIAVHTDQAGHEFNEMELHSLLRFGWHAGTELEKAELLDHLQLLLDSSNILAEAHDVNTALEILVEKVTKACPSSVCHILLRTRSGDSLRVRKERVVSRREPLKWQSSEGKICGLFTKRRVEKIVGDLKSVVLSRGEATHDCYLSQIDAHLQLDAPLHSVLLIPMRIGTETVGLCFLGEIRQTREDEPRRVSFTRENLRLAEAIASQAATRIDHFRALEIEKERANALKRLNEVGNAIAATQNLDQVLKMIVEHGQTLLNAEVCAVFLAGRDGFLTLKANCGSPEGSFKEGRELEIGPNAGLTGYIAYMREKFNMHGEELRGHPAVKNRGQQSHLPSRRCESILAIPLKRRSDEKEAVIGLIKVENKKDRGGQLDTVVGFDGDDEFTLKTLADCAVTAIQNGQIFGLTRTQQEVAKVVSSTLDLNKVLRQVLTELHHLILFDTSSIQLVTGEELEIVACEGFDEKDTEKVLNLSFPLWDTKFPNHRVITSKEPFLLPDIRTSRYRHFWDEADVYMAGHIRSWLGVPLLHGDEVVGMISIDSKTPKRYTELDKDLGKAFASHVVSAIVQARLYKSFQSLIEVTADITQQLNLEAVLKRIAKDATNKGAFIGADIAIIHLYNPDEDSFMEDPVYDGALNDSTKVTPPFAEGSVVWRFIREKDFRFRYENRTGDDLNLARGFADREKVVSAFGLKLAVGDKPVGVMFVNYRTPHRFSNIEVGLLDLFGQLAAIAIQRARQYESVSLNLKLARDVAMTGIFASILSHDIKGPASSIRFYARALEASIGESLEGREALVRIDKLAEGIESSFPSSSSRPEAQVVDVNKLLEELKERRRNELSSNNVNMQIILESVPTIRGDPTLITFVFDNLVSNAIRFMPGGGNLTFSGRKDDSRLLLECADTGPGVSEAVRSQLLKGPVDDPDSPGRGCGLWYSKYILEIMGGDIFLPIHDERGNVFTLSLPFAQDQGDEK